MTTTLKLSDIVPTTGGPAVTNQTLDSFRQNKWRFPDFPKPFKIGHANFYKRAELVAWKRKRDAVRKAK
jgi:predicted DNA-binding transcriptional regulator AlpA